MKFGESLKTHLTTEWRTQYIDYDRLKDLLEEFKLNNPDPINEEELSEQAIKEKHRAYRKFKEIFFDVVENEMIKVNTFFLEQLNASERRFRDLDTGFGFIFINNGQAAALH